MDFSQTIESDFKSAQVGLAGFSWPGECDSDDFFASFFSLLFLYANFVRLCTRPLTSLVLWPHWGHTGHSFFL